jgi:FkbM family methyltransferase
MIGLAKRIAQRLVVGTRFEAPVKRIHHRLTGSKNSLYDALTIEVMRRVLRRDSNAIDVGAFEGGMLSHMARFAPRGTHFAFEPLEDRYEGLVRAFPSARVYPYAVGESPGEAVFHRAVRHPALSGLRRRDLGPEEAIQDVTVTVETLDRIIPEDLPISLVKIDVEGGELGVFRGGIGTLRRSRPVIVFECGLGGANWFGSEPEQIYDCVAAAIGLRISLLDAWLSGGAPLTRAQFASQYRDRINFYFIAHP